MIFSCDYCPLCNDKLKFEVTSVALNKVGFYYFCKKTEIVTKKNGCFSAYHYQNINNEAAEMLIPPFRIIHDAQLKTTMVLQLTNKKNEKIIFKTSLLDMDYSKTQDVIARIQRLVIFS